MNISIDGMAGSGKSFLGRELAKTLDYKFISAGKMYRALSYEFLKTDYDMNDMDDVILFLRDVNLGIKFDGCCAKVVLNGQVLSDEVLETDAVSDTTRQLSKIQIVRDRVLALQRNVAQNYNVVMEGRDIGSVVLPNAEVKFFIMAPDDLRYARILDREIKNGVNTDSDRVKNLTKQRDESDMNRKNSPLVKPNGAIVINNAGNLEIVDYLIHAMATVVRNSEKANEIMNRYSNRVSSGDIKIVAMRV